MHPTKKEMTIAFCSVGALALLCVFIALIVASTRPGGTYERTPSTPFVSRKPAPFVETRDSKQKWLMIVTLPSGSRTIVIEDFNSEFDEVKANTESRLARGKPRVEGQTIHYRDWLKGADHTWTADPDKEIHIEPLNEWKE